MAVETILQLHQGLSRLEAGAHRVDMAEVVEPLDLLPPGDAGRD